MKLNLNKKNWQKVKFGDLVVQQKESISIEDRQLGDRYIAGEHMDTEDIHIRRWGEIDGSYLGPAFHRTFKKGDILYGSRRTYLKKVAVAHFDGITSNTTFVIRPNEEIINPRLVPFLMLSDKFTQHSVKNSKGSVNPYINFKDIAKFELLLPPLDEQKKLADLLWAGDELLQKYSFLKYKFNILYESSVQALNKGTSSLELTSCKLGDVLNINPENISSKTDGETEIIYIDISSISYKNILRNEIKKFLFKDAPSRAKRRVKEDDVIVSLVRPYQQQIVTAKNIKENTLSSTGTAILRSNDKPLLNLIYHQLFSRNFIYFCERIMTGTNYPAITADDLAKFKVFSYDDQKKNKLMSDKFSAIENEIIALSKNIAITKTLNDSLRNKFFS